MPEQPIVTPANVIKHLRGMLDRQRVALASELPQWRAWREQQVTGIEHAVVAIECGRRPLDVITPMLAWIGGEERVLVSALQHSLRTDRRDASVLHFWHVIDGDLVHD